MRGDGAFLSDSENCSQEPVGHPGAQLVPVRKLSEGALFLASLPFSSFLRTKRIETSWEEKAGYMGPLALAQLLPEKSYIVSRMV